MAALGLLLLLLTGLALIYQVVALLALGCFRRRPAAAAPLSDPPGISVLKPVRGLEPGLAACLASFLEQDYPDYEVLFGVADPTDPVLPLLRDLQARYPQVPVQVVLCPEILGRNPKVSTLQQLLPRARHQVLVAADSDVLAPPELLRTVAAALAPPEMGLVSCLYTSLPPATPGAALEALTISADFIPGVAVAHYLEGISFALGAVMAWKRELLPRIGGLQAVADYLADDYQLGWRISQTGHQVAVLPLVVLTGNPHQSFGGYFSHQLRWSRTYRVCRPAGYLAFGITFAFPWALLAWLTGGAGFWLPLVVLGSRAVLALLNHHRLTGYYPWRWLGWLPLKEILTFTIWLLSFLGREVSWQGRRYLVQPDGRLQPRP